MKEFLNYDKLQIGDQVAVISPSAGVPGLFPWVFELGLKRLKDFGLKPQEYPTTRQMGSSLEDRARDIMAAFCDPANKAVVTSIGGNDQIRLLKYLDPEALSANPKPFFGFSDNTHLHNYLWQLGIPTYYGGAVMTQFAMQGAMHDLTCNFLKHALFDSGEFELEVSTEYTDQGLNWADPDNLNAQRVMEPNAGWLWDGDKDVSGQLWGGCVESLIAQFSVGKYLPGQSELAGSILILETSEELPQPWSVEYLLYGMGERGWLDSFQAVLVGRPKAWEFDKPNSQQEKVTYTQTQQQAVLDTIRFYNKNIPIVQNLDFGHTDPQICMPLGRKARVLSSTQQIFAEF